MYPIRYRSRRRSRLSTTRSLIAFLLVALFGILFAGCSNGQRDASPDEFVFTEEDAARFRELAGGKKQQTGATVELLLPDTFEEEGSKKLNLSLASTYEAIRSGPAAVGEDLFRVVHPFLNVRTEPRVTAPLLKQLSAGDLLRVREFTDAAWARVELLPEGKEGYVTQRYVAKLTSEEGLAVEKKKFHGLFFVDFGFLNVRRSADAQSEKLGELPGQALVRPLSMDDTWARIPFDGKEGYVARQYLSPFLPNFLVRQEAYTLPILHYRLGEEGVLSAFRTHVERLRSEGISFLSARDFRDLLLQQEERDVRLDPQSVLLVLSGLTVENMKGVLDGLRTVQVPATLFLETQHIGLAGITEKILLTLLGNGFDIQSAGHTGDDLRSLTNSQVELELRQSRGILEEATKRTVFAILYPRGGVNDRVMQKAAEAGYLLGVGTAPEYTFHREQLLRLPSFAVLPETSTEEVVKFVRTGERASTQEVEKTP